MSIVEQRIATAVAIVKDRLVHDDPQLPGAELRARRIVDDLVDAGVIGLGRRVEALPAERVAAWL